MPVLVLASIVVVSAPGAGLVATGLVFILMGVTR